MANQYQNWSEVPGLARWNLGKNGKPLVFVRNAELRSRQLFESFWQVFRVLPEELSDNGCSGNCGPALSHGNRGHFMKGARPICFCKIYLKRSPVPSAGRSFSSQYLIGNRVPRDRGSANSCTSGTSCANCKESAQDKCKGSHRAQLRPINCVDKQSCRLKLRQFAIFPLSSIHCNICNYIIAHPVLFQFNSRRWDIVR